MAIESIDSELCIGCGSCVNTCPLDVIRMDDPGKCAIIKYPDDCVSCGYCEPDCPVNAIKVALEKHVPPIVSWC
jgi:NAD-dependent dihydropyrimidine dehydrogenase PreA subunit